MTVRAQVLFLFLAGLIIFYPAFSADICSIDDTQLFKSLEHNTASHPFASFTGRGKSLLYFRPLLGTTFWIDKNMFHIDPFWMHLENVLYHLISMILLYFIGRFLFRKHLNSHPLLPFLIALFWGLHPLTTESVNWISGRTDLLAGMFLFASTLSLLRFQDKKKKRLLVLAGFSWLLAIFSKEVALAFAPGAFFIFLASFEKNPGKIKSLLHNWKSTLFYLLLALSPLLLFFLFRSGVSVSNSSRIGLTLLYIQNNPEHTLMLCARALGFYIKKIFFPWPLNFAIIDVDPLYDLLAIPIVLFSLYCLLKRSLTAVFFLTGIFLLTPSFLIALNQIAWTAFAERYVYISMAFILLGCFGLLVRTIPVGYEKFFTGALVTLICIFTATTLQRNIVWHSNNRIIHDTAIKSPNFKRIQWIYGAALARQGELATALQQTKKACTLPDSPFVKDFTPESNLATIYFRMGDLNKAAYHFGQVVKKSNGKFLPALEGLTQVQGVLAVQATDPKAKEEYYLASRKNSNRLYEARKDPMIWYTLGKLALRMEKTKDAITFFRKAYETFPEDSPYKKFAHTLSTRLDNNT